MVELAAVLGETFDVATLVAAGDADRVQVMTVIDEEQEAEAYRRAAHDLDDIARHNGARTIVVTYVIADDGHVYATVLGGCCPTHTVKALADAIRVVASYNAFMDDEEDHRHVH